MMRIIANGCNLAISREVLQTLALSAIEVYPRETEGQLWGTNGGTTYNVSTAYPIQTSIRKPNSVGHGNKAAMKRLRSLEPALARKTIETRVLGEFHSHPKSDSQKHPSENDLSFFDDLMDARKQPYWLEAILHISRFNTAHPMDISATLAHHPRKVTLTIRDTEYTGYKLSVGAYMKHRTGELYELKVSVK